MSGKYSGSRRTVLVNNLGGKVTSRGTDVREEKGSAPAPSPEFDLDLALRRSLRPDPPQISAHLICLQRDISVGGTKTKLHCYFLPNARLGRAALAPQAMVAPNEALSSEAPKE